MKSAWFANDILEKEKRGKLDAVFYVLEFAFDLFVPVAIGGTVIILLLAYLHS